MTDGGYESPIPIRSDDGWEVWLTSSFDPSVHGEDLCGLLDPWIREVQNCRDKKTWFSFLIFILLSGTLGQIKNPALHWICCDGNNFFVVYYETIKRELNRRLIYECRCDERLKDKGYGSTRLVYLVRNKVYGWGVPTYELFNPPT
jgi:hypothetical protein